MTGLFLTKSEYTGFQFIPSKDAREFFFHRGPAQFNHGTALIKMTFGIYNLLVLTILYRMSNIPWKKMFFAKVENQLNAGQFQKRENLMLDKSKKFLYTSSG